jgi:hypothetical protein
MDFDRAASKLKKEQEKRRQEAQKRLERCVRLVFFFRFFKVGRRGLVGGIIH